MKLVSSLVGLVLLIVAVSFAMSNRQTSTISLWPFDLAFEAPLYILTLGTLGTGLVVGAGFTWLSLLPHRLETKRLHADIALIHDKLNEMHAAMTVRGVLPSTDLPLHRRLLNRIGFGRDAEL